VEYPNGYVTLDGHLPDYSFGNLHPGDTHPLVAVVKNNVGTVLSSGLLNYSSTNTGCAGVDATGVVTGVQAATCTITVTDGTHSGNMSFDVTGTTRTWTGATSTDWAAGGNWSGGLVPVATDSVTIPFGVPNYPALTAPVTVRGVTVADNATLSLGAFNLTSNANVGTGATAGGGILSTTGSLVLAGSASTVHGRIPTFLVTGDYALDGDVTAVAKGQVDLARLVSTSFNLQVVAQ